MIDLLVGVAAASCNHDRSYARFAGAQSAMPRPGPEACSVSICSTGLGRDCIDKLVVALSDLGGRSVVGHVYKKGRGDAAASGRG